MHPVYDLLSNSEATLKGMGMTDQYQSTTAQTTCIIPGIHWRQEIIYPGNLLNADLTDIWRCMAFMFCLDISRQLIMGLIINSPTGKFRKDDVSTQLHRIIADFSDGQRRMLFLGIFIKTPIIFAHTYAKHLLHIVGEIFLCILLIW